MKAEKWRPISFVKWPEKTIKKFLLYSENFKMKKTAVKVCVRAERRQNRVIQKNEVRPC
jgi:hypothetical protein